MNKKLLLSAAVCFAVLCAAAVLRVSAADGACGSNAYKGGYMIPGPAEAGYDAALAAEARRHDRQFHAFNAQPMGAGSDVMVPAAEPERRRMIEDFILKSDGWDFEKYSGRSVFDAVGGWEKTAGLYAGVGVAADAFRYAVLRDQNADCGEIEIARKQMIAALDAMHLAFTIPGKPGVVARGFLRKDLPGFAQRAKTMPLADEQGRPLPLVKNNGTWREDGSGRYPDYIWEDSISRDQMLGWAMASAVASEVMRGDASFPESVKSRLRADAAMVCKAMRKVNKNGYDLEFPDSDGRTTFFGHLNENNLDGKYLPGLKNGFYAMMALGIYAAYSYASEDPELDKYLYGTLIKKRRLPQIAIEHMKFIDMGAGSNFSNYNMVFTAAWLATRYINDDAALADLRKAVEVQIYEIPGAERQPVEQKDSLFDFIYSAAKTEGTAFSAPVKPGDAGAMSRGIETLREFPKAPFFDFTVANCDEKEIAAGVCTLNDGTEVHLLGNVGWGDQLVADKPIPMKIRPSSNYYWRSNPYEPNGGGSGDHLDMAADFRVAYWLGRWTRIPEVAEK